MEYINSLIYYFQLYPYIVVLLAFLLIMLLFPIPEELILLTGGFLSAQSAYSNIIWLPTLAAGIFGIVLTDYYFFLIFRIFGHKLVNNKLFKRMFSHKKLDVIINYFHKFGVWTLIVVRFIPGGVRIPTFAVAGLTHLPHRKFILSVFCGSLISSQISFWLGYWFKNKIGGIEEVINIISKRISIVILAAVGLLLLYFIIKKIISKIKAHKDKKNYTASNENQ